MAVAGVILMSTAFFFFHPYYPAGQPLSIKTPPPPKTIPPNFSFFQNQTADIWNLGKISANVTNFNFSTISGNTNTTVEGYLSSTNGTPISGTGVYVAEYPLAVYLKTDSSGKYMFHTTKFGYGHILIKPAHYRREAVTFNLNGGILWRNLTFQPAELHDLSGFTLSSNGSAVSGVSLYFNGTMGTNTTMSSSDGFYSISLYNDTYQIAVYAQGYTNVPSPNYLLLRGNHPGLFNLTLKQSNTPYTINGKVVTVGNHPVPSAVVTDVLTSTPTYSALDGNFSVPASSGINTLITTHLGFYENMTNISVMHSNVYNVTVFLKPIDPFLNATLNASATIPLNSSNVNYSDPVNATIIGYVFGWNNMPVADQTFTVGLRLNGSVFQGKVPTNVNGMYGFKLEYGGYYNLSFSSPIYKTGCLSFHLTGRYVYKNVSVATISSLFGTLSGSIINKVDGKAVQNATVSIFGGNLPKINVSAGGGLTGNYNMQTYPGYYNLNVTGPGFSENLSNAVFPSASDSTIGIDLNPSRYIGPGVSRWNVSDGTDLPSVPASGPGSPGANVNVGSTYFETPISVSLTLSISGHPEAGLRFELYVSVNDVHYRWINQTNPSGNSILKLYNTGEYDFLVESLNSNSSPILTQILSDQGLSISLTARLDYRMSVIITNSYNQTHGITNLSVPRQVLNVTNSIFPISFHANQSLSGTNFSSLLPDGTYNLSYLNSAYVTNSTSLSLLGSPLKYDWSATPYLLILNYKTAAAWGVNIIATSTDIWSNHTAGPGSVIEYLSAGSFALYFYLSGYGSPTNSTTMTLASSSPEQTQYYNITNESTQLIFTSGSSVSGGYIFNYSGSVNNGYAFAGNVSSLNYTHLLGVALNGVPYTFTPYPEGQTTTYFSFSPVSLSGHTTVGIDFNGTSSPSTTINIFYYSVSQQT